MLQRLPQVSQFLELAGHLVYSNHKRPQWIFEHEYLLEQYQH